MEAKKAVSIEEMLQQLKDMQQKDDEKTAYIRSLETENTKLKEQKEHLMKCMECTTSENMMLKTELDHLKHGFEIYEKQMDVVKMIFLGKEGEK